MKYLNWDMCVEEIIFEDGTMIELAGNADYGKFDNITLPNGDYFGIFEN